MGSNKQEYNIKPNYEIDFVGNTSSGDADAIAFRWKDLNGNYHVCVYDCGTEAQAERMIDLLNDYYFDECDEEEKVIDAIIISHPDGDHINGITRLMDEFTINEMYFNIPWDYAEELVELSNNYKSADYLISILKRKYSKLSEIEKMANEKDIPIYSVFQGTMICDELLVLAPSEDEYIEHLLLSDKTPVKAAFEAYNEIKFNVDFWDEDNLLENPSTSEENETSVIILGLYNSENERFMLLGDAGVKNINSALEYAEDVFLDIRETTSFLQVPHHGGRHNLDTDTMNRLVGEIKGKESETGKTAFISVGRNSEHPRQCVVNAFKRRGVKIYKTTGNTIHHNIGDIPKRDGWKKLVQLDFEEEYDE